MRPTNAASNHLYNSPSEPRQRLYDWSTLQALHHEEDVRVWSVVISFVSEDGTDGLTD